jgi:CRISPR/Cas system endoribonuclease Cas6 (RAMP superfamily)
MTGIGIPEVMGAGKLVMHGGQAVQAMSHTFNFERGIVELGDFIFYYGLGEKRYGGFFDSSKKLKQEV